MTRIEPTTTIDIIGRLDLDPEDAIGSYLASKQQNNYFIKPPVWDSPGDTVELNFINVKREHEAMLMQQTESLDGAKRQAIINQLHTDRLYKIQANLRRRMIEANLFMRECVDKKYLAEKQVATEIRSHGILRKAIEECKGSVTKLTRFRRTLRDTIAEYEPYERIMSEVVAKSDIFESILDCIVRCDALMLTQVDITEMNTLKLQEIRNIHERFKKITADAALKILGLKNDLAELERSFNEANARCSYWEKVLENAKNAIAKNDYEKENVIGGIHSMYKILCKRKGQNPTLHRQEVEKQLDFIKDEIELLQEVLINLGSQHRTKDYGPIMGCI